jgi:Spy/CpxP family protein refolding chaperone
MKRLLSAVMLLVCACSLAVAQMQGNEQHGSMPGMAMHPPRALSDNWWRDPEVINELRLTDAQRKQLEQTSTNMKLSLISAAATAAGALVKGESALNSDQLDEASYSQQVTAAADAASKLVKDLGGTMLAMRKILSAEQWRKLETMRRSERETRRPMPRENERRPAPPQE